MARGTIKMAMAIVMLACTCCVLGDPSELPAAQDKAQTAALHAATREHDHLQTKQAIPAGLESPKQGHVKQQLKEALDAWDSADPSTHQQRADGAAKVAADLEAELARKAAGASDVALDAIMAAVSADAGDKRKVLYSLLSEDYRQGGNSQYNKNDYYVRHQNERMAVTTFSGAMDRQDATFKIVSALCEPGSGACPNQNPGSAGCVSFESVNWQRTFLVQAAAGELSFQAGDGSDGFRSAATFCLKPGVGNKDSGVSIEPLGQPEVYVLHDGYHLVVAPIARASALAATFRLRPGLFMGFCQGPDNPTECTCLGGFLGDECAQPCPALTVTPSGVIEVCSNRGDCVLDSETSAAVCLCHDGFLGAECNLLCPRSDKNGKLCHGHGECGVNEAFQPTCKCEHGFLGKDCSVPCPGVAGDLGACSDHGSCTLDGTTNTAKCTCNAGFLGDDCFLSCPRDQADNVCGGNGECSAQGDANTKCDCKPGWVGSACDLECPSNKAGDVCSDHGECVQKDHKAACVCQGGFLGPACSAECPGIATLHESTVGCNGHGDCQLDLETLTAFCHCHDGDGWVGEGCTKQCPNGVDSNGVEGAVCSGHGKCALNDEEEATCECDALFSGNNCGVNCPTATAGVVCSGHGKCSAAPTNGTAVSKGQCECEPDWLGNDCGATCAKDQDGLVCHGHGKCQVDEKTQQASCACSPQWGGSATCSERKCGTQAGFWSSDKNECKCPATSEKCCSRDVIAKAALLDKILAQRKTLKNKSELLTDFLTDSQEREVLALEA